MIYGQDWDDYVDECDEELQEELEEQRREDADRRREEKEDLARFDSQFSGGNNGRKEKR